MSNFFGLFNYNKEGPGISKDQPQKKRFFLFFDIYFRRFWKLVTLNLLYLACCIPIVTIGAATAGFTYVIRNYAREDHCFLVSDFFGTIKKNWKMATVVNLINIVFSFLFIFSFLFYLDFDNVIFSTIATSVMVLVGIIFISMQYYIYLLLITFKLTFRQLYKNSFLFAIIGLWRNILVSILLLLLSLVIFLFYPISLFLVLFIYLSTCGFAIMFIIYPNVKKYMIDPIVNKDENTENSNDGEQIFKDNTQNLK